MISHFAKAAFESIKQVTDTSGDNDEWWSESLWCQFHQISASRICSSSSSSRVPKPQLPWLVFLRSTQRAKTPVLFNHFNIIKTVQMIFINLDTCSIEYSSATCLVYWNNKKVLTRRFLHLACFFFTWCFIWSGLMGQSFYPVAVWIRRRTDSTGSF